MSVLWSRSAAEYLRRTTICPRCDYVLTNYTFCAKCGADLSGEPALAVLTKSRSIADAIEARELLAADLPTHPEYTAAQARLAAPISRAPQPVMASVAPRPESDSLSVQSVLAVVGAALVGIAAIVFTFFNPDLRDTGVRTLIIAIVTLLFLGSAGLMARTRLRFSAEAVGALGGVFVALDVYSFASQAFPGIAVWALAGVGTIVGALALGAIGLLARIRTWLWLGMVGLVLSPAMFGYAASESPNEAIAGWGPIIGHLGAGVLALLVHALTTRLGTRYESRLRADEGTATVIQLIVVAVVAIQLVLVEGLDGTARAFATAAVLAVLAALAALSTRAQIPRLWSILAGMLMVSAVAVLSFAVTLEDSAWYVALIALAATVGVAALAAIPTPAPIRRTHLLGGAWSVLLIVGQPALILMFVHAAFPSEFAFGADNTDTASILGLFSVGLGTAALWWFGRRSPATRPLARGAIATGIWIAGFVAVDLTLWTKLIPAGRAGVGVGIALLIALGLVFLPRLQRAALAARIPMIATAHILPIIAGLIAAREEPLLIPVGIAALVVWIPVAHTLPRTIRPLHTTIGYAYALGLFTAALANAGVETSAVLCFVTSLGSLAALAATLIPQIEKRHWWAILAVTTVPFLIGIASVITERSGWTGVSTAITFALALTLVLTRRPGLTIVVRGLAAALLVPALAVVVICFGAQFLEVSGSPITLPIIAVIVAIVLPLVTRIEVALEQHGITVAEARVVRSAIEASSLLTGVIAVLLALIRSAAGVGTTFVVLVILGIGAAATALFARRFYGWPLSFASFTGALWCFLFLSNVDVLEPYLLPPTLAAALIGAILVLRDREATARPGLWLYWIGLGVTPLPTLGLLALWGTDGELGQPWRTPALLVGAGVLLVVAFLCARGTGRLSCAPKLTVPTAVVALIAASAGAVQAVRFGRELDASYAGFGEAIMTPILGLSVIAAVLAGISGSLLARELRPSALKRTDGILTRWYYLPALVFLVAGPISSVRKGWFPIWTLWGLAVALLIFMLAVASRARRERVTLPPVWAVYVVAWFTAVAGWSIRDLRVEAFSLPLGLALLGAGVLAMRPAADDVAIGRGTLSSWPIRFSGSWRLLAPGIIATLLPSMLATGTDPQTWRAITVLALALIAILIGSLRKLGAPFLLGIIALPIEIAIVFAVQIGTTISATWWWITLATAGAVLLVIATTYERRSGGDKGLAARMRDLA